LGASRIILARELDFDEIYEIRQAAPELEIEIFVHGAVCMAYSGRCMMSKYFTGRCANKGACAQPCRWNYSIVEETREGEYMPIFENERGTFLFNSKDLCLIDSLDKLKEIGVCSFKIEGRNKSDYYLAATTKAYRSVLDGEITPEEGFLELEKVSHRDYTGIGGNDFVYTSSSYIRKSEVVGVIEDYDNDLKMAKCSQRGKFYFGDDLEILTPKGYKNIKIKSCEIFEEKSGEIIKLDSTPHPTMPFYLKSEFIPKGSYLRREIK
jgi:putative protease